MSAVSVAAVPRRHLHRRRRAPRASHATVSPSHSLGVETVRQPVPARPSPATRGDAPGREGRRAAWSGAHPSCCSQALLLAGGAYPGPAPHGRRFVGRSQRAGEEVAEAVAIQRDLMRHHWRDRHARGRERPVMAGTFGGGAFERAGEHAPPRAARRRASGHRRKGPETRDDPGAGDRDRRHPQRRGPSVLQPPALKLARRFAPVLASPRLLAVHTPPSRTGAR